MPLIDGKRKTAGKARDATAGRLLALFASLAPAEDLAGYDEANLERAAAHAAAALKRHRRGDAVVEVAADSDVTVNGRAVTLVTLVNDNMPFLFDSVMGEITQRAGEARLALHPVLPVRHGGEVTEIVGDGVPGRQDLRDDRVSLIHVHVARMDEEAAARLKERLLYVLSQVRAAVGDWKPMLARLDLAIADLRDTAAPLEKDYLAEALAFLEWLRADNFVFLGIRELRYTGNKRSGILQPSPRPGLGILADPGVAVLRRGTEPVDATSEIRAFLHGPEPLIVTKANAKSVVHRHAYLDYVGVKTFDAHGRLTGELRIVGLFTSSAYTWSVRKIPYLRSKVTAVMEKSGHDPNDHSGRALLNVLEAYPRDELFQIRIALLRKQAAAIVALSERPRVRVLHRVDRFDRFVSVLVFVPRERYDTAARLRIGDYLKAVFDGRLSASYPSFPEGPLARVHFIIGRSGGRTPRVESAVLEAGVRAIVRTWEDALRETADDIDAPSAHVAIALRFPHGYRESFDARSALADAALIERLGEDGGIAIDFYHKGEHAACAAALKIYHRDEPVALSRRVPLLENMGFRVINERTFEAEGVQARPVFIHDMQVESATGRPVDLSDGGELLEEVFLSVWRGTSDNDGYAGLVQTAGLDAGRISVLRAYGGYLQQAGIPQSPDFVASTLNRYPAIARALFALFEARFSPDADDDREAARLGIKEKIKAALEEVPSLDEDTILRRFQNLIDATLRTNHYAPEDGEPRSLAFKLDPHAITALPEPRAWREIFVHGPEVEGVHLRFGPVARGGLRWSDRAQDYRTEVLGLVKAQQVKNAVIVPVGAKGGFYPKRLPAAGSRQEIFEAGRQAYVNFVASLLSVTDNLDEGVPVPPPGVVRHDGDDPYLVVAADKGTATFSDTANAISARHGFWLDDAFASGGSAGYDHKKMGITARGGWEAVKRHFREMNRDIQREPFTVTGVGDMSGDVFGNAMLLSPCTRLLAAFDHRDIFIDPDPDPAASFEERRRLFDKGQSSWQDYDRSKLSPGGTIVSRFQKSVVLSEAAAAMLGFPIRIATPAEIMNAILRAPVDLLWFGGIGTYVRGSTESNRDVGDRNNDAIRVTAAQLRAKVVGEGANLGMTQRARIEFGLAGGRCNSDAIDNSAGVNSSDMEVNIKIALAGAVRKGDLTRAARDGLLAEMTQEVARLVLANNYRQTLAVSLAARRGLIDLAHHERFMEALEARGLLDRAVEVLPSPQAMAEREKRGEPLTRAEIAVLLAYAKIVLFDELLAGTVPDDPYFEAELVAYFPAQMGKAHADDIRGHRLRRQIIATELVNDAINRGGPAFVNRLQDQTGRSVGEVVAAFVVVRDGFELKDLYARIDALDNKVEGDLQLNLHQAVGRLLYTATGWLLRNAADNAPIGERVERLAAARRALEPELEAMLPASAVERMEERRHRFFKAGAPEEIAHAIAFLNIAELVPDILLAAHLADADIHRTATAFFAVTEAFRVGAISEAARAVPASDYYDALALSRALDAIGAARRGIVVAALAAHGREDEPVTAWLAAGGERISRVRERLQALTEGGDLTVSRLTVAAGLLADLA